MRKLLNRVFRINDTISKFKFIFFICIKAMYFIIVKSIRLNAVLFKQRGKIWNDSVYLYILIYLNKYLKALHAVGLGTYRK